MDKNDLYYQIALSQLEEQEQRRRSFDTRATGISAVAVAVTGFAMFALRDYDPQWDWVAAVILGLAVATVSVLLGVMTLGAYVLAPGDWQRRPDLPKDFRERLAGYENDNLTSWAGEEYRESIVHNEPLLAERARWLVWQTKLIIGLVVLAIFLAASVKLLG